MAKGYDPQKRAKDMGADSPASEEAKQQGISGDRGAGAAQSGAAQSPSQPEQSSNRRPANSEQPPQQRKHFAPGQAPSEQGDKDHPSPEQVARHQQGIGRQSGSHGAHSERSQEEAVAGEPRGEHTRSGRQQVPGDRKQNQT